MNKTVPLTFEGHVIGTAEVNISESDSVEGFAIAVVTATINDESIGHVVNGYVIRNITSDPVNPWRSAPQGTFTVSCECGFWRYHRDKESLVGDLSSNGWRQLVGGYWSCPRGHVAGPIATAP